MARLCVRPGCSEPGAVAFGMVPEDLLFWIAAIEESRSADTMLLCARHADAMVVPRGWTLDDRREPTLRLFKPRPARSGAGTARERRRRRPRGAAVDDAPVQLQIDGTGEIARTVTPAARAAADDVTEPGDDQPGDDQPGDDEPGDDDRSSAPWRPTFDTSDDLDGLLAVSSPLLSRAFGGAERARR